MEYNLKTFLKIDNNIICPFHVDKDRDAIINFAKLCSNNDVKVVQIFEKEGCDAEIQEDDIWDIYNKTKSYENTKQS